MLKLDQRPSGIWRIRGTFHGVRIDQSAKTRNKKQAEIIRKAWEKQIFADVHGLSTQTKNTTTLAQIIELWLDGGGTPDAFPYLHLIIKSVGDISIQDFTQSFIDRTAMSLMPTQSAATRKRHFYTPISIFLALAADEGFVSYRKIRRPKVKEKPTFILTPPEIESLLNADPDFADTLTFLVGTGARASEAFGLNWKHVSAYSNRVTFWDTKNNRARSVDLCARTRAAMPTRQEGQVWRQPENNAEWQKNEKTNRYYGPANRLARLSQRLGLRRIGPHTFRHSWASWQYAIHKDPLQLMRDGGWSDQKMIERYVHLGGPDLANQVIEHGWFQENNLGKIRAVI